MSCSVECVSCISCYSLHSPAYINWLTSCSCSHFTRLLSLSLWLGVCVVSTSSLAWLAPLAGEWLALPGPPAVWWPACWLTCTSYTTHRLQTNTPTFLTSHTLTVWYVGWSLWENVFLFCFVLKGSVEGGRGGHQDGDVSGWSVTSCDCTGVLRTALLPTPASLLSPSTLVMIKCPYTVLVLELVNVYVRWTSGNLVIW